MREAVARGAGLINDVYALRREGALEEAVRLGTAVCLMHMQGAPRTMQENQRFVDVVSEVVAFLEVRIAACDARGLARERIVIDPGIGFGKSEQQNVRLLARLSQLGRPGLPVLVGLSRKRTLGSLTGRGVDERIPAGVAAAVLAVERGAHIVRTHDVGPTVDALAMATAVMRCV
jgi:dihydropteroate synthase